MTAKTAIARVAELPDRDDASLSGPQWLTAHRHFLIDLDGTLVRGKVVADGAGELLRRLHGRYAVVSNNSIDTADSLARKLRRMGLEVAADRLVLAGQATIDFIVRTQPDARVLLIAGATLRSYAQRRGCILVEQEPDLVVLALDKRFTYAKLGMAANELKRGARLIVTNPDVSHPSPGYGLVPETGALMHAIVQCSGVEPALIVGKPESTLFVEGLRRLQANAAETLVIGDNPHTDAHGAVRMGMRYLLVGRHALADAPTPAQLLQLPHGGHAHAPVAQRDGHAVGMPLRVELSTV